MMNILARKGKTHKPDNQKNLKENMASSNASDQSQYSMHLTIPAPLNLSNNLKGNQEILLKVIMAARSSMTPPKPKWSR